MNFTLDISYYNLLFFSITGLLLWGLMMLSHRLLFRLSKINHAWKRVQTQYFPVIQGFIWFVFGVCSLFMIFKSRSFVQALAIFFCLVFLVWISWFALRDLVAGLILRLQGAFPVNKRVSIKELNGRVRKLGSLSFELETYQGELISIPYSQVFHAIRIKPNQEEAVKSHSLTLVLPRKHSLSDTVEKVRLSILHAPWSSLLKKPHVEVLEETPDTFRLRLVLYSFQGLYFQKIKEYVLRVYEDMPL